MLSRMNNTTPSDPSPAATLDAVIAVCLRAAELDIPVDREALLSRHPKLADHLRTFFAAQDHPAPVPTHIVAERVGGPEGAAAEAVESPRPLICSPDEAPQPVVLDRNV